MGSTKLLFITSEFPPQPGGIGNHAHHVAKNLCDHDFDVTVITDVRSKTADQEAKFDASQPYTVRRVLRKSPVIFTYLKRFQVAHKLLKKHHLLLASGKFPLWVGGMLCFFTNKKMFAVVHGSELKKENKFTNWCLSKFTSIIAVSKYTKSLLPPALQKKCNVIPNGFEIDALCTESLKKLDQIRLITVGNVSERKGQQNVIKALPGILKHFPAIKYDIVGIPTEKDTMLALAKNIGVEDTIVFHGNVSEEKKIELLKDSTVFMMLSQPTSSGAVEGFGIAILEANALGIPAIGSINCGIEDAISHNYSGKLVNPTSEPQIIKAFSDILENHTTYSKNALKWSQNFTWDKIIDSYVTVLKT